MAKQFPPRPKFQVVAEVLTGEKSVAQVAKAYNIHLNIVGAWNRAFLEKGP